MRLLFSHVSHAVYIFAYVDSSSDSTVCLCFPFEHSIKPDPKPRSKGLGGTKHFRGSRLLFLLHFIIKNFLGKTKFGGAQKIRGNCPRMPPVATGLIPILRTPC